MSVCHICGTELPGTERLCRDCYNYEYWRVTGPKPTFWEKLGQGAPSILACLGALILIPGMYWVFAHGPVVAQRIVTGVTSFLLWLFGRYVLLQSRPEDKSRHQVVFWMVFAANGFFSLVFLLNGVGIWKWLSFSVMLLFGIYMMTVRAATSEG